MLTNSEFLRPHEIAGQARNDGIVQSHNDEINQSHNDEIGQARNDGIDQSHNKNYRHPEL